MLLRRQPCARSWRRELPPPFGTALAEPGVETVAMLVRLLGFVSLGCGCVVGRYREVDSNRELTYVEEKGAACAVAAHRRNHSVSLVRRAPVPVSFRRVA